MTLLLVWGGPTGTLSSADARPPPPLHLQFGLAAPGLAGALEAAMLGAGAAGLLQALAQRRSGSVQPYGRVIGCDAELAGDVRQRAALQLDAAEHLGVLRFQGRDQVVNALADGAFERRFELGLALGVFGNVALYAALQGGLPTVVIDERVAQQAIEPGH